MTRFERALERFENAVRAHAFKGATTPDRWSDLDREYEEARHNLIMQRKLS